MINLPHIDDGSVAAESDRPAAARGRLWAEASERAALPTLIATCVVLFAYRWAIIEWDPLRGYLVDDAYISARHAQNLVEGHGLNFNADERIEGYTNFLFTLLLAIPQGLGLALEPFVRALGALSALAVVMMTAAMARIICGAVVAGLVAAALVVDPRFVFFSLWGLETVFVSLPCVLGVYWLFQRRLACASLAFAAALMTRMDMLMVVAPAVFYGLGSAWVNRRARPFLQSLSFLVLPCAVIFGGYFALRWAYYGWMLPNTFYAKVGNPINAWRRGAEYVDECFGAMGIRGLVCASLAAWLVCLAIYAVRWKQTSADDKTALARALAIFASALAYVMFTITVGGDHFHERFIYHVMPFIMLASVTPWALLGRALGRKIPASGKPTVLFGGAFAALLAISLGQSPHRFGTFDALAGWAALGHYLKERAPVGAVLATDAAGALPYFSGLRTIDILGLANPAIAHRPAPNIGGGVAGHEKSDPNYVVEQRPEYISTWIDSDGGAGRGFKNVAGFDELYRLSAVVRTDIPWASTERILTFTEDPPSQQVVALQQGTGKVPGRYNWGLYSRRLDHDYRMVKSAAFRSNLPGWAPSPDYIVHAPRGHAPAHIMYGPFARFKPGAHVGYLRAKVDAAKDVDHRQRLCVFDVFNGKRTTTEMTISAGEGQGTTAEIPFSFNVQPDEAANPIEFRLYCWGIADVTVESVHVR